MAKFKTNHSGSEKKGTFTLSSRLLILLAVMLFAMWNLFQVLQDYDFSDLNTGEKKGQTKVQILAPEGKNKEIVKHSKFTLSYDEETEQAEWVYYTLSQNKLLAPKVPRYDYFNPDPKVSTKSAVHSDYSHSGYTRGHLVPAGDMSHNKQGMKECFYMSNMSPQPRAFNNGIWKELEELVREWVIEEKLLHISSGPIFYNSDRKTIGKKNKIHVPDAFFKVLLDYRGTEKKAIGFVIPNEVSDKQLKYYAKSVDEVEAITGIDFFTSDTHGDLFDELESDLDVGQWKFSKHKYQLRVDKWNNQ